MGFWYTPNHLACEIVSLFWDFSYAVWKNMTMRGTRDIAEALITRAIDYSQCIWSAVLYIFFQWDYIHHPITERPTSDPLPETICSRPMVNLRNEPDQDKPFDGLSLFLKLLSLERGLYHNHLCSVKHSLRWLGNTGKQKNYAPDEPNVSAWD